MHRPMFSQRPREGIKTLFLVIFSIALLFLDVRGQLPRSRYYLEGIVSPLQYTVSLPFYLAEKTSEAITSHDALVKENEALKAKLLFEQLRSQKLHSVEKENQALKALMSSSQYVGVDVKIAEVMSVFISSGKQEVMLREGERQGVYPGQPVLDAFGIVGQVINVGPDTSRVMLISDQRSAIPVENNRTGFRAILEGDDDRLLLMHVPKTEDIQKGDIFVTSGLDRRFPQGYPVGVVSDVSQPMEESFSVITVKSSAHLHRIRFVLLLWPKEVQS